MAAGHVSKNALLFEIMVETAFWGGILSSLIRVTAAVIQVFNNRGHIADRGYIALDCLYGRKRTIE